MDEIIQPVTAYFLSDIIDFRYTKQLLPNYKTHAGSAGNRHAKSAHSVVSGSEHSIAKGIYCI